MLREYIQGQRAWALLQHARQWNESLVFRSHQTKGLEPGYLGETRAEAKTPRRQTPRPTLLAPSHHFLLGRAATVSIKLVTFTIEMMETVTGGCQLPGKMGGTQRWGISTATVWYKEEKVQRGMAISAETA